MMRIAEFVGLFSFCTLLAWCAQPDPRAPIYGGERLLCVQQHDAAAEARACVKAIDSAFGQDAGVK